MNTLFVTAARDSLYQYIDIFVPIFTELTDMANICSAELHFFLIKY
jgi:hypothetical protein